MYRNTYVEVDLKNIEYNVKTLINKYNEYKYYFGVVKADCYGHNDIKTIKTIIKGGCNYLAVATLEEALYIRKRVRNIPILCLGIINKNYINLCIENNITITINNLNYLKSILNSKITNLKVHIKINTGMNRLGVNNQKEFEEMVNVIKKNNIFLEGIYTHIHSANKEKATLNQLAKFETITAHINLATIPIVHIYASDALINYKKPPYANGCRLGIAMYGLCDNNSLKLKSTFSLWSEIITINEVENETIGYNGAYKAEKKESIAVIPIGYADGIIRKNTGRFVFIKKKPYQIVGNICMDMLFVKVDKTIKVGDKVCIIKDIDHIKSIAKHLETINYEVICSIGKRVPRIYK